MPSFTQPQDLSKLPPTIGVVQQIKLDAIVASPFNPRQEFDKDGIADLALSIKSNGLLENLIVREGKKPGTFELMGGERRWRALKLNKAEFADCRVLKADDGEAIALQIVENLQRQDLSALEEAEAFKALHDQDSKVWTVQAIATKVGKTPRFVQQRIAIAGGLTAPLKAKFAAGEISVEAARTLAPLPASIQKAVPEWAIERGDARDIRKQAFELCIPESAAKFELKLYTGEWIEDDSKRKYFFDVAQFRKLQKVAAEKKLVEVQKEWPKAQLVEIEEAGKLYWADEQYAYSHHGRLSDRAGDKPTKFHVPKEKCTAIVWIAENGEIRKALGVCTAAAINAVSARRYQSSGGVAAPVSEKADHKKARATFNTAFKARFAKRHDLAPRLQLLQRVSDRGLDDDLVKFLPPTLKDFEYAAWKQKEKDQAEIWRAIAALPIATVTQTLTRLAIAEPPTWDAHEWRQRPLLMVAMAETIGVAVPAIAAPAKPKAKTAVKKVAAKKKHS